VHTQPRPAAAASTVLNESDKRAMVTDNWIVNGGCLSLLGPSIGVLPAPQTMGPLHKRLGRLGGGPKDRRTVASLLRRLICSGSSAQVDS